MRNYAEDLELNGVDILNITAALETFKEYRENELKEARLKNDYESEKILKEIIHDIEMTSLKFDKILRPILNEGLNNADEEMQKEILDILIDSFFTSTVEYGITETLKSMPIEVVKERLIELGLEESYIKKLSDVELRAELIKLEMESIVNERE